MFGQILGFDLGFYLRFVKIITLIYLYNMFFLNYRFIAAYVYVYIFIYFMLCV